MQDCGDHADTAERPPDSAVPASAFVTTHWTVVQSLGASDPEVARAALERQGKPPQ